MKKSNLFLFTIVIIIAVNAVLTIFFNKYKNSDGFLLLATCDVILFIFLLGWRLKLRNREF